MDEAGSKLLRGLLEVFVLESLEREPKHGYAMLKDMADAFGVEPNRNRIYPLLGRLVKEGWVREVTDADAGRTVYALTDAGSEALQDYRRLPHEFRHALDRVWRLDAARSPTAAAQPKGEPPKTDAPASPAAAQTAAPPRASAAAPTIAAPGAQPATTAPRTTSIPVHAGPLPDGDTLPYPCTDARFGLTKDPRTGDLNISLTGCPMGKYDYCPECPVFKSVEGVRRAVFSF